MKYGPVCGVWGCGEMPSLSPGRGCPPDGGQVRESHHRRILSRPQGFSLIRSADVLLKMIVQEAEAVKRALRAD
jgi:hypothetical protein